MKFWLKHPRSGKEDTMLTLAVAATAVTLCKFLVNGTEIGFLNFGSVDSGLVASILTPTLGAYVLRKYSDSPDKQTNRTTRKK